MGRRKWSAVRCALLSLAVCLTACWTNAEVVIDYDTTIDYTINDDVRIIEGADPPTTVEIVVEADIAGSVTVQDQSVVNMSGGIVHCDTGTAITATDSSTVNILSGTVASSDGIALRTTGSSTVNIHDGQISSEADMPVGGSSTLNIYGGTVWDEVQAVEFGTVNIYEGYVDDLDGADASVLNILGGEVQTPDVSNTSVMSIFDGTVIGAHAAGNGLISIYGGTVIGAHAVGNGLISIYGGEIGLSLRAGNDFGDPHNCVITIYGTDFNYPYGPILDASGVLTGTLANGDTIDCPFEIYSDASIVLVPEPTTLLLLTMAAVGLLPRNLRRRVRAG